MTIFFVDRYLVGCDNILAKLHTQHPELCDKVGGLLAMHIDDLRALAPLWLSKTEEVREDRTHWGTNYTGDIYAQGWISEMYGYSFGAAEVGLRHKINDNLMLYPGYTPRDGIEPILLHYGLPFNVGNWSFTKLDHHEDNIVYDCGRLFPEPPYPRDVKEMEPDYNKRRGLFLNIECMNTLNEGLLLQHAAYGCPKPKWSKYLSFLKSKTFADSTRPKLLSPKSRQIMEVDSKPKVVEEAQTKKVVKEAQAKTNADEQPKIKPKIHTIFSTECSSYFDWQTVGLLHSFYQSGQPGNITRLLSCTDEELKQYQGHDLAPTHYVPSMSRHPLTGDWYPAINKPAAIVHWIHNAKIDAEYIVILDADMIMRGPITPWEFNVAKGRPVSTPYDYLIGCDNDLARLHTHYPEYCDKVGGVIIIHTNELHRLAPLWLHKTEEVRHDTSHWSKDFTGDIYESGWISEMYGYSFGAAELRLRHIISNEILIYPGYVPAPGVNYRVLHYGLEFRVGEWGFDKANWRHVDVVNKCWAKFPEPPDPSTLDQSDEEAFQRDLLSIECVRTLNEALYLHHQRSKCPDPNLLPVLHEVTDTEIKKTDTETKKTTETEPKQTTETEPFIETKTSRNSAKVDRIHAIRLGTNPDNDSLELSPPVTNQTDPGATSQSFISMRLWIIGLWTLSIFGFILVMSMMLSSRRQKKRSRNLKGKRRSTYSGFWDINGHDKHSRSGDSS
ncbi:hypothetical protein Leryth_009338 [Lithospermum erythrorhizon]|nr:hypothetical protein Leryth_009338 [Lithospermum erythrorhizon]